MLCKELRSLATFSCPATSNGAALVRSAALSPSEDNQPQVVAQQFQERVLSAETPGGLLQGCRCWKMSLSKHWAHREGHASYPETELC